MFTIRTTRRARCAPFILVGLLAACAGPELELVESSWVRASSGRTASGRVVVEGDRVTATTDGGPSSSATLTAEGRRRLDEALAQLADGWSPPYDGPAGPGESSTHRLLRDGEVEETVVHLLADDDLGELAALSDLTVRITVDATLTCPTELVVQDVQVPFCPTRR